MANSLGLWPDRAFALTFYIVAPELPSASTSRHRPPASGTSVICMC